MAFDGTLKFDTSIDQTGFQSGLSGLGDLAKAGLSGLGDIAKAGVSAVTGAVTALTGATAAATGAVTALGKQAVESYADFEQLAGGVETLFGDSAQIVMNNAAKAFETAGMSANQYMETATASAAAMVNSLSGDTKRAAELTDMAVVDMSDNINKMGSTAESVQNAYAGFAKGNFTMLDNLKLGYGGTKQEMERLLQTAQKLSGVEFSIDSYADIVQAIHVIQENMGVSGTTAKEAAETISGSVAMVKAAWSNMLVGIADDTQDFDQLTDNLVTSVEAAAKNILPRVEVTAGGIVKLVDGLSDEAVQLLADLVGYVPMATNAGVSLIQALAGGIRDNLPQLLSAGRDTILSLSDGITGAAPVLFDATGSIAAGLAETLSDPQVLGSIGRAGSAVVSGFVSGIASSAPAIIQTGLDMGMKMLSGFGDITVNFLDLGANLASGLATGIQAKLPQISGMSREILLRIIKSVGDNLPVMLESGADIVEMLAGAISDNLDRLTVFGNYAVKQIAESIKNTLPVILQAGAGLIGAFGESILNSLPVLLDCAVQIMQTLVDVISNPDDLSALIAAGILIIQTLGGALLDNLQPLLDAGMQVIGGLIGTLSDPDAVAGLLQAGIGIIMGLVNAITQNAAPLAGVAVQIITVLGTALISNTPMLLDAAFGIANALIQALSNPGMLTGLLDAALNFITSFGTLLVENLTPLLGAVIQMIATLGAWIGEHALDLVGAGLVIVQALLDAVTQNLPLLLDAAVLIVEGLARGIEEDSADVLIAIEHIIRTLLDFLLSPDTLGKIGETGVKIIKALIPAAIELAGDLIVFAWDLFTELNSAMQQIAWGDAAKQILNGMMTELTGTDFDLDAFFENFWTDWWTGFTGIWDNTVQGFKDFWDDILAIDWSGLGGDIISGIINGIQDVDLGPLNGVKDTLLTGMKALFEIESPSKLMKREVGEYLGLGTLEGFVDGVSEIGDEAAEAFTNIPDIPLAFDVPEIPELSEIPLTFEEPEVPELSEIPVAFEEPEIPELSEIPLGFEEPEIPEMPDIPLGFEEPEIPEFSDEITVSLAEEAANILASIRNPQISPNVEPAALDLMLNTPPISASDMVQPSPTASITNNYSTYSTTNSADYSTENAPSGDIIIPVQIGSEQVETIVITAAQIANARSGGEVL